MKSLTGIYPKDRQVTDRFSYALRELELSLVIRPDQPDIQ